MSRYVVEDEQPAAPSGRYQIDTTPPPVDKGTFHAVGQGMSKTVMDLYDGLLQAYAAGKGDEGATLARGLKGLREQESPAYELVQRQHPFATGIGQALPYAAIPGGPGAAALGAGLVGAASYGTPEERTKAAAFNATTTYAGGKIGQELGKTLTGKYGPSNLPTKESVAAADRIGAPLSSGQRTGVRGWQMREDTLARTPGSSGVFAKQADDQQRAVNEAVARSLGVQTESGRLPQEAVAGARKAADLERNAMKAASNLDAAAPEVLAALDSASSKLRGMLPEMMKTTASKIDVDPAVKDLISAIVNKQTISGPQYQQLRTALMDSADQAFNAKNTVLGEFYKTLRTGLDDIVQSGGKEAWKRSDVKFATLRLLEGTEHVWNSATGNVSPKNYASAFSRAYGSAAKEGRIPGDANDVLLFARGIKQYPEGSQTLGRQAYSSLTDAALGPIRWAEARMRASPSVAGAAEPAARFLANGLAPNNPALQAQIMGAARVGGKPIPMAGLLGLRAQYPDETGLLGQ